MDSPSSSLESANIDLSKLTGAEKQELQQFVANEMQKGRVQQSVHALTDVCWKKCVTGPIRSRKLDKSEETCAQNCVGRFLDANLTVIKHLERMRSQQ